MHLDRAKVDRLLRAAGFGAASRLLPVPGGANNRVYEVDHADGTVLLKVYFRHPDDPRDRMGNEFAFSHFAMTAGATCIPRPLECDVDSGMGLFEFVRGRRVEREDLSEQLMEQVIEFIRTVNEGRWRPSAASLPVASESCFTLEEHLATVGRRVVRLMKMSTASDIDREALRFVETELKPLWDTVRDHLRARMRTHAAGRMLEHGGRCISPSDLGFHNALIRDSGEVCFLDFEYAGWDDPAKLICDFFCQPGIPVPARWFHTFASSVALCFLEPEVVLNRSRLLLPLYRVKWLCILLNEFLPVGQERRCFAREPDELEDRKVQQLAQARAAMNSFRTPERISA
jgi:Ser/Thr protein kinase RdoA (MazF antagonist)